MRSHSGRALCQAQEEAEEVEAKLSPGEARALRSGWDLRLAPPSCDNETSKPLFHRRGFVVSMLFGWRG